MRSKRRVRTACVRIQDIQVHRRWRHYLTARLVKGGKIRFTAAQSPRNIVPGRDEATEEQMRMSSAATISALRSCKPTTIHMRLIEQWRVGYLMGELKKSLQVDRTECTDGGNIDPRKAIRQQSHVQLPIHVKHANYVSQCSPATELGMKWRR